MSRRYPDRPFVGVGVIVFKDADVLLIRRGKPPRKGGWSLPGGVQELGETVVEAAIREVAEETGISIHPPQLIEVFDSISRDPDGAVEYHYTLVDLMARWREGEPVAGDDAMAAAWHPVRDIRSLDMWEETYNVIEAAFHRLAAG